MKQKQKEDKDCCGKDERGAIGGTAWTGDIKCREVKTWFCWKREMQTGSFETPIGWKSRRKNTYVLLWDWMEGAWLWTHRRYDMDGRSQMQGGKKWILPKEINANRFFWHSLWLEIWKNHSCPSMGPNGGSLWDRMEGAWQWTQGRGLTKPNPADGTYLSRNLTKPEHCWIK